MREQLKAFTGVDIMDKANGTYKDTYTILREMAGVWDDLGDMDKAGALELMAGKNRSNILAAILTNEEDLKNAYETAQNAAGSAMRENMTYLDSIQGRMDLFTNALQTFWMNAISSDMIKGIVDQGTSLLQFFDTWYGKVTALGAAMAVLVKFSKSISFKELANSAIGYTKDVFGRGKANGGNVSRAVGTIEDPNAQRAVQTKLDGTVKNFSTIGTLSKDQTNQMNNAFKEVIASKKQEVEGLNKVSKDFGKFETGKDVFKSVKANISGIENRETRVKITDELKSGDGDINKAIKATDKLTAAQREYAKSVIQTNAAQAQAQVSMIQTAHAQSGLNQGLGRIGTSFKNLGKSIGDFAKANPLMVAIAGFTAANAIADKLITTTSERSEKSLSTFSDLASAADATQSEITSLKDEMGSLDQQMAQLEGRSLTFVEAQELERLQHEQDVAKRTIKDREKLLKEQQKVTGEQGAIAYDDFLKSTAVDTDGAEKAGMAIGGAVLAGLLGAIAAPFTAGLSTLAAGAIIAGSVGVGAGIGINAGKWAGGAIASNDVNNIEQWYEGHSKALEEARAAEEKAYQKYLGDPSSTKEQEKWQKAKQASLDLETDFNENMSQLQGLIASMDYGYDKDANKKLNDYYNFMDKKNIKDYGAGAKADAIERLFGKDSEYIFGGKAGKSVENLQKQIEKAKESGKDFDIIDAIKNEKGLEGLRDELDYLDIDIQDVADYFNKTGEVGVEAVGRITDAIDEASSAQEKLSSALQVNSHAGYDTRDEATDKVSELLKIGATGNLSDIWTYASAAGYQRDYSRTNEAEVARLEKWNNIRKQWYQRDDSGNVMAEGAASFARSIEAAAKSNKELQKQGFKWEIGENGLEYDFNNLNLDTIIEELGKTGAAMDLTKEEFIDLMTALGQYGQVQWETPEDLLNVVNSLGENTSAQDKIDAIRTSLGTILQEAEQWDGDTINDFLSGDGNLKNIPDELQPIIDKYKELMNIAAENEGKELPFPEFELTNYDVDSSVYKNAAIEAKKGLSESIPLAGQVKLDVSGIDDDQTKIETLKTSFNQLENLKKLNLDDSQLEQVNSMMKYVLKQQQELENPVIMNVDTSKADSKIQNAISLLQQYHRAQNENETNKKLGLDTSESSKKVQDLKSQIENLDPNVKAKLNLDTTSTESLNKSIQGLTSDKLKPLKVKVIADTSKTNVNKGKGKKLKVKADLDKSAVTKWNPKDKTLHVNAKLKGKNDINNWTPKSKTQWVTVKKKGDIEANGTAHLSGTAHAQGTALRSGDWRVKKSETALVGELGTEIRVRDGKWETIGDSGAEFTNIKKGDIIFNHKQTEEIFKNGYVTSRGKMAKASGTAHAEGTAYASGGWTGIGSSSSTRNSSSSSGSSKTSSGNNKKSKSKSNKKDTEILDFVEIKLKEINTQLDLAEARMVNIVNYAGKSGKNAILDGMISTIKSQTKALADGADEYEAWAETYFKKIPKKWQEMAKNGDISVIEVASKSNKKAAENIRNYREWIEKADDLKKQLEEAKNHAAELAHQKFTNISDALEKFQKINGNRKSYLESAISLIESQGNIAGDKIYDALIKREKDNQGEITGKMKELQAQLNANVKSGVFDVGSKQWHEEVSAIQELANSLIESDQKIEDWENKKLENYWAKFDAKIKRYENTTNEMQNIIDVLEKQDNLVYKYDSDDLGNNKVGDWTNEGLTAAGLYAQQMEVAEIQTKQYSKAIENLNKQYADGMCSESEYTEKLNELKDAQYDSIGNYYDARDAIVDLTEARVDAIKDGIDEERKALEKLIDKKKEELDSEKD